MSAAWIGAAAEAARPLLEGKAITSVAQYSASAALLPLAAAIALGIASGAEAQSSGQANAGPATRTTHVVGGIYMISGAGGNVTVSVGDSGILIVDAGAADASDALLAAIHDISDKPLRYIVNSSALPEHSGGNAAIRVAGQTFTGGNATVVGGVDEGAAIVGHERTLFRLADLPDVPPAALPTETFFVSKHDLYFNDEPVELMYQPSAVDDTNVIVHFRRSDVISTGDIFRMDSYPFIDLENGGSIDGVLDSLNFFIELAVSDTLAEGGTLIVPGHGRVCDEGDLVRYRDMVTIIRDRIKAMVAAGKTLQQVKASRPTLDSASRWGATSGPWTTDMFIEAVYNSLTS
jgi:glyoxylase-like metal-dependent hydrolase (beta-lactamase superfamily II)